VARSAGASSASLGRRGRGARAGRRVRELTLSARPLDRHRPARRTRPAPPRLAPRPPHAPSYPGRPIPTALPPVRLVAAGGLVPSRTVPECWPAADDRLSSESGGTSGEVEAGKSARASPFSGVSATGSLAASPSFPSTESGWRSGTWCERAAGRPSGTLRRRAVPEPMTSPRSRWRGFERCGGPPLRTDAGRAGAVPRPGRASRAGDGRAPLTFRPRSSGEVGSGAGPGGESDGRDGTSVGALPSGLRWACSSACCCSRGDHLGDKRARLHGDTKRSRHGKKVEGCYRMARLFRRPAESGASLLSSKLSLRNSGFTSALPGRGEPVRVVFGADGPADGSFPKASGSPRPLLVTDRPEEHKDRPARSFRLSVGVETGP